MMMDRDEGKQEMHRNNTNVREKGAGARLSIGMCRGVRIIYDKITFVNIKT